jgi:hypothetical protein
MGLQLKHVPDDHPGHVGPAQPVRGVLQRLARIAFGDIAQRF